MKKSIIVIILILSISCKNSTQDKISDAIIKIERSQFENNGNKVEKISLDSLKFKPSSEAGYWLSYNLYLFSVEKELNNSSIESISYHEKIDSIIKIADTANNLFEVKYIVKYVTNKSKGERNRVIFLKQSDLTEFDLPKPALPEVHKVLDTLPKINF